MDLVIPRPGSQPDPKHTGIATTILALNSGSSSLKFGLFRVDTAQAECLFHGQFEGIGNADGALEVWDAAGRAWNESFKPTHSLQEAVFQIRGLLVEFNTPGPAAIGHRIVHGGMQFSRHTVIDDTVLDALHGAVTLAPLHMPAALSVIQQAQEYFPWLPQVACFDTAFHAGLPDLARVLPLPRALRDQGVRRYGFHGLSCESILEQLPQPLPQRLIVAHLGSGASVTAILAGRSIDTSMGMSPAGGVPMGTRSGDLDPGVLIYLLRQQHLDASALEDLVNRRAGLLGLSDLDSDLRRLREAATNNPDARLAVDVFCYGVRKSIAAMVAALGGLDMLVFTGGIGENDSVTRQQVCRDLAFLGLKLDEEKNRASVRAINAPDSSAEVRVLPALEERHIARLTYSLCPD